MNYTNLTWNELLKKANNWFDLPRVVKEGFTRLKALIAENTADIAELQAPSYKVYSALITQEGTNDPEANVLENTLGVDVVWSRNNVGNYYCTTSQNILLFNKTLVVGNSNSENGSGFSYNPIGASGELTGYYGYYLDGVNLIILQTIGIDGEDIEFSTLLDSTTIPIEIRVYS